MDKLKFYNVSAEIISKYDENEKYIAVSDNWLLTKDENTKETLDLSKKQEGRLRFRVDEHNIISMAVSDLLRNYDVKVKHVELHGYYEGRNLTFINHDKYYHMCS